MEHVKWQVGITYRILLVYLRARAKLFYYLRPFSIKHHHRAIQISVSMSIHSFWVSFFFFFLRHEINTWCHQFRKLGIGGKWHVFYFILTNIFMIQKGQKTNLLVDTQTYQQQTLLYFWDINSFMQQETNKFNAVSLRFLQPNNSNSTQSLHQNKLRCLRPQLLE